MIYDVIIIGGGPAGLYSAIKLKEKNVENILILEFEDSLGGALSDVIEVDHNFGEFGTTGVELSQQLIEEVESIGIEYKVSNQVISVSRELEVEVLTKESGIVNYRAKSIIFATGSRERPRGILNYTSNKLNGIFSVGTARRFIVKEGYLPGNRVLIYGSDITGIYLSKLLKVEGANEVTIVDQYKEIRFPNEEFKVVLDALGIKVIQGYSIKEVIGSNRIEGVILKSNSDGDEIELECDSLLLSVGLTPRRDLSKKFRRDPENSGVFHVGNAENITFDMNDLKDNVKSTLLRVVDFLNK